MSLSKRKIISCFLSCILFVSMALNGYSDDTIDQSEIFKRERSVSTVYSDIPGIFHNDEAWYRDSVTPALNKGGKLHVPIDLFDVFCDYSLEKNNSNEDILLFTFERNGEKNYISILFSSAAACVNGTIYEDVSIFRDNGQYYIAPEFMCEMMGLKLEYSDITGAVRISDERAEMSFNELIESYIQNDDEIIEDTESESTETVADTKQSVRIHLLCYDMGDEYVETSASRFADEYGIKYTLLITEKSSDERIMKLIGEESVIGITSGNSENELKNLTDRVKNLTGVRPHTVIDTGVGIDDSRYECITPDYVISLYTDADWVYGDIKADADSGKDVTVCVTDCWQAQRLMILLYESGYYIYTDILG